MRYINLHFTYLLTYFYLLTCREKQKQIANVDYLNTVYTTNAFHLASCQHVAGA